MYFLTMATIDERAEDLIRQIEEEFYEENGYNSDDEFSRSEWNYEKYQFAQFWLDNHNLTLVLKMQYEQNYGTIYNWIMANIEE